MNAVGADGFTTLHSAAGCGKTEAVHKLIKHGATRSVVASSWYGTPLHQAIYFMDMLRLLKPFWRVKFLNLI